MIVATVCGGAEGVWDEYERTEELLDATLGPDDEIVRVACNDAAIEHPDPLHHWCTLHHEKLAKWIQARSEAGRTSVPTTWGVVVRKSLDEIQRVWKGGSSGLLCVDVALHRLGADAVILCGVPMDDRRNRFSGKEWRQVTRYWPDWQKARGELLGPVRSWAGRTREMLREPDAEWLAERRNVAERAGSDAA